MSKAISVPTVVADSVLKNRLLETIPLFAGKKILILGDIGLDEYIMGEVRRISPEAPVPVLEVEKEDMRLGLAGNVAQNVRSLGGNPILVSVVGKDTGADLLNSLLKQSGVSTDYLVVDPARPTTRKARVMAKHHHLVRVDYEIRRYLSPETEQKVIAICDQALDQVDAVIVEDYAKGVITQPLQQKIIQMAHAKKKKVYLDPHRSTP